MNQRSKKFARTALGLAMCAAAGGTAFGQGYRSAVFSGGQYVNVTVPAVAPFKSLGSTRVEFRISAWATGRIANFGNIFVNASQGLIQATSFFDGGSPTVQLSLNPSSDYLVRIQRDVRTKLFSLEAWSADGTAQYLQGQSTGTNMGGVTDTGLHDYSGTIAVGYNGGGGYLTGQIAWLRWYSTTVPTASQPPGNVPGGDLLDLEFEGTTSDSSSRHLKSTGTGIAYTNTALTVLFASSSPTARAGAPAVIDASPTAGVSYAWQQTGGSEACTLSSASAPNPAVTGCMAFGEYDFQVTVTDALGRTTSGTLALGIVPASQTGVVTIADPTVDFIVGPQMIAGFSPWPWYDLQIAQMSDYWYGNPASRQGNGMCQAQQSGCTWGGLINPGGDPSIDYYDAVLVNYQEYYRTGLTRYQTRARALAQFFWGAYWNSGAPAGGCASNWTAPRDGGAAGLLLYAHESGDSSVYPCIDAWIDWEYTNYLVTQSASNGHTSFSFGGREPGYAFYFATLEAQRDPNNSMYQWLSRLSPAFNNVWKAFQCSSSSTSPECTSDTPPMTGSSISVASNSSSVTGSGTQFTAINPAARFWVYDASQGWNYFGIKSIQDNTHLTLTRVYPYGSQGAAQWSYDRPLSRAVPPGAYRWNDPAWPGYGEQGWHIGIAMEGLSNYHELTADPAALQVMELWVQGNTAGEVVTGGCAGVPGLNCNFEYYAQYCGTCPFGATCTDPGSLSNSRAQNNTLPHIYGYLYKVTRNRAYLTIGDLLFGADYGGQIGPDSDAIVGLGGATVNNGKEYGQSFRSSGHYLAYRTAVASPNRHKMLAARFNPRSVAGARKVHVTVTLPDGATSSTICERSPCWIAGGTENGEARLRLDYLSAAGAVLSTTEQTIKSGQ